MTGTELFRQHTINQSFVSRNESMTQYVQDLAADDFQDSEFDTLVDEATKAGLVRVPKLSLHGTEYTTRDAGDTVHVSAAIPFGGDFAVLSQTPEHFSVPSIRANIKRSVLSGRSHHIELVHGFPIGTPVDEIKKYFRAEAAKIQKVLDEIDRVVDEHNAKVPARARAMVEARKVHVDSLRSLDDQLGTGL